MATLPNQVWAYGFVFDGCANGQKLKWLTVDDEFNNQSLFSDVACSIRSQQLIEVLKKLIGKRGCPLVSQSDNRQVFVSLDLLQRAADKALRIHLIEPGKHWQKATNESINGKFRDECLAMNWIYSRAHAKVIIEAWRQHYNEVRSHSSLDYKTSLEVMSEWNNQSSN